MPYVRPLDPGASPMAFFGSEVRHARTDAHMSQAELAGIIPCDPSTVSRVEAASYEPPDGFPEGCDRAFPNRGGFFARFYRDAHEWVGPYPRWFLDWVDAEGRAVAIRWWEPLLIPGLLQTPEYARSLFRAWLTAGNEEELEELVAARIARQAIFDGATPPNLWAVLDETVLHRCIGGAAVMREQLIYLAGLAARPTIRVHVIPAEVGAHVGLLGAFAISSVDSDAPDVVYMESPDEGETTKNPATVSKISLTFDILRSEALPHGASRDLIMKVAEDKWT